MSAQQKAPNPELVARFIGAAVVLVLVAANLGTVDVNLMLLSMPVPVALLVIAPAAVGAFGALRWNAARLRAERDRRERRREMDHLLGRRPPVSVRH